jgi:hypothetical protein
VSIIRITTVIQNYIFNQDHHAYPEYKPPFVVYPASVRSRAELKRKKGGCALPDRPVIARGAGGIADGAARNAGCLL